MRLATNVLFFSVVHFDIRFLTQAPYVCFMYSRCVPCATVAHFIFTFTWCTVRFSSPIHVKKQAKIFKNSIMDSIHIYPRIYMHARQRIINKPEGLISVTYPIWTHTGIAWIRQSCCVMFSGICGNNLAVKFNRLNILKRHDNQRIVRIPSDRNAFFMLFNVKHNSTKRNTIIGDYQSINGNGKWIQKQLELSNKHLITYHPLPVATHSMHSRFDFIRCTLFFVINSNLDQSANKSKKVSDFV